MSLKELLVCTFAGCTNGIYKDARLMPCGARTCAEHVEQMLITFDEQTMIKCCFCAKIHLVPRDEDGFPRDVFVPHLLSMDHGKAHQQAKQMLDAVTSELTHLSSTSSSSSSSLDLVLDYFRRVEADVQLEREAKQTELNAHYDGLVEHIHACKTKCIESLPTTTSQQIESDIGQLVQQQASAMRSELTKSEFEFDLRIANGDKAKWKHIQRECQSVRERIAALAADLEEKLIGEQAIVFEPASASATSSSSSVKSLCSRIRSNAVQSTASVDSTILASHELRRDFLRVCKFKNNFKLLYRASRDGFLAKTFHWRCDNKDKTVTIIKTKSGCVFGGYADAVWHRCSGNKNDPHAFIFSLVSPSLQRRALHIPVKANGEDALFGNSVNGPSFSLDIVVADRSNENCKSYSNLGYAYNFGALDDYGSDYALNFLAGSFHFQTEEIEVFQLI